MAAMCSATKQAADQSRLRSKHAEEDRVVQLPERPAKRGQQHSHAIAEAAWLCEGSAQTSEYQGRAKCTSQGIRLIGDVERLFQSSGCHAAGHEGDPSLSTASRPFAHPIPCGKDAIRICRQSA